MKKLLLLLLLVAGCTGKPKKGESWALYHKGLLWNSGEVMFDTRDMDAIVDSVKVNWVYFHHRDSPWLKRSFPISRFTDQYMKLPE